MSAAPARAPRLTPGAPRRPRPRLRIVTTPAPGRSRVGFTLLCISILVSAMLAALMLNTAMAATAYDINDQRVELAQLSETEQSLAQQVHHLQSPVVLQQKAEDLGMERSDDVRYITLAEQQILSHDPDEQE